jgi:hypothetical protein
MSYMSESLLKILEKQISQTLTNIYHYNYNKIMFKYI